MPLCLVEETTIPPNESPCPRRRQLARLISKTYKSYLRVDPLAALLFIEWRHIFPTWTPLTAPLLEPYLCHVIYAPFVDAVGAAQLIYQSLISLLEHLNFKRRHVEKVDRRTCKTVLCIKLNEYKAKSEYIVNANKKKQPLRGWWYWNAGGLEEKWLPEVK